MRISIKRWIGCAVLLTLIACQQEQVVTEKKKPTTLPLPQSAQAEQYLVDLSAAQLALAAPAARDADAKTYIEPLNRYTEENKKQTKPVTLPVVILQYKLADSREMREIVAPVNDEFRSLKQLYSALSALPYTIHHIRIRQASITPAATLRLPHETISAVRERLVANQRQVLRTAGTLPVLHDAKLHMQLVRFFLRERIKDSAYIALENVKSALAVAALKSSHREEVQVLSAEADSLEDTLHREMPYVL